jgi:hypothetical protein
VRKQALIGGVDELVDVVRSLVNGNVRG